VGDEVSTGAEECPLLEAITREQLVKTQKLRKDLLVYILFLFI
jgi:hypothetical protein